MKLSQDRFWKINYLQNKKYPCISRHQYFRLEYLKQRKNNWKQVKNTKKCEYLMFWKTFISGVPGSSQTVHLLEDYFLSSLEGLTLWCWSSGSEKYSFDVRANPLVLAKRWLSKALSIPIPRLYMLYKSYSLITDACYCGVTLFPFSHTHRVKKEGSFLYTSRY